MNKQALVKAIAQDTGATQVQVQSIVQSLELRVAEALANGDTVELRGFGTFKTTERAAYKGKNPATGETVVVPAQNRVRFVAGKGLKEAVN